MVLAHNAREAAIGTSSLTDAGAPPVVLEQHVAAVPTSGDREACYVYTRT